MKTSYFTFGYDHEHVIDGQVFNRDTIAKVTAPDPRAVMVETFGRKWSFEYDPEKAKDQIEKWGYRVVELHV